MSTTFYRMHIDTPYDHQPDCIHISIDRGEIVEILTLIADAVGGQKAHIELEFWGTLKQEA